MATLILLFLCRLIFGWISMWIYIVLRIALWPFWPAIERTVSRIRYSPNPLLEILLILLKVVEKILIGFMIIVALITATEVYGKFREWRQSKQEPVMEESKTTCQSYMNRGTTYILTGELNA